MDRGPQSSIADDWLHQQDIKVDTYIEVPSEVGNKPDRVCYGSISGVITNVLVAACLRCAVGTKCRLLRRIYLLCRIGMACMGGRPDSFVL